MAPLRLDINIDCTIHNILQNLAVCLILLLFYFFFSAEWALFQ